MIEQSVAKKKRGFPRKSGEVSPVTIRTRNLRDREKIQEMAEQVAVASASAAAKSLTPPSMSDDLRELIESSAAEVSRILATNSPAVIQATIDKAVGGDVGAAALLLKHCISTKTKIKLPVERGDTIESFADSIVAAASAGELSLEDSDAALRLLQRHSEVSLNSGLVQRLASLNAQLADARARNIITEDVTLNRKAIPLEDFVKGVRY
jgi:hypothetical protein